MCNKKILTFRDLGASDIECRVQSVKKNGLILLLYKNARVDMNILDETVGSMNWQREHYECKGNLFCRVGIDFNGIQDNGLPPNWVWKADCGTESNTEAQKGEASDSFKRACFNWGIGRELYTSPFIWVPADRCNIDNGKCYDNFTVADINITNKLIMSLSIWNETKKCIAFHWSVASGDKNGDKKEPPLTYEAALELKLASGDYKGMTLREIWKTDANYIKWLSENENTSQKLLEAIRIINAEIRKANAK